MRIDECHFTKTLPRPETLLFMVVTDPLPSLCSVEFPANPLRPDDLDEFDCLPSARCTGFLPKRETLRSRIHTPYLFTLAIKQPARPL